MAVAVFQVARCRSTRKLWVGAARGVAGVRRLIGDFIRAVHPDLTSDFPDIARRVNARSLSELNSYIDRLEFEGGVPLELGPEVARDLPFFREYQTRGGRVIPGRVVPWHLPLPTLSVSAPESEREYAAVRLVRNAEVLLATSPSDMSNQPTVDPLFTQKDAGRKEFDKMWWHQTNEEAMNSVLYGPDDAQVRRHEAMNVFARKYEFRLLRRYMKINNKQRRRRKMEQLSNTVTAMVEAQFGVASPSTLSSHEEEEEDGNERWDKVRVIKSGFHPDLVFTAPTLTGTQRQEAIRRVCGMNLKSDADFWLLENLWKAMRGTPPPVPLVLADEGYVAHEGTGFVQVPWNFLVGELCDLLEEHLESLREGIKCRRSTSGSATGTEGLHLPPVPLIDTPLDEESFEDEDDIPIELEHSG